MAEKTDCLLTAQFDKLFRIWKTPLRLRAGWVSSAVAMAQRDAKFDNEVCIAKLETVVALLCEEFCDDIMKIIPRGKKTHELTTEFRRAVMTLLLRDHDLRSLRFDNRGFDAHGTGIRITAGRAGITLRTLGHENGGMAASLNWRQASLCELIFDEFANKSEPRGLETLFAWTDGRRSVVEICPSCRTDQLELAITIQHTDEFIRNGSEGEEPDSLSAAGGWVALPWEAESLFLFLRHHRERHFGTGAATHDELRENEFEFEKEA